MDLINFVNKEYRTKTVAEILTNGNTDGEAGLSRQEVQKLIQDGYNKNSFIFGTVKFFCGMKKMTNSVFNALDKDDNKIISLKECDDYAQEKCGCTLKELWSMTVADVCIKIDEVSRKDSNKKEL